MTCSSTELPESHSTTDKINGIDNRGFQNDTTHSHNEERSSAPAVVKDHTQDNGSADTHHEKDTIELPDENSYCGIGSCRPPCVQICKNMASFSAAVTLASLVASALNAYITSQITTLERHFNFSSSISGFLLSCNDIGYLVTTLFMSYYTRRVHVPRAMALSTAVYGVSGILCAVAFFGTRDQLTSPPKESMDDNAPIIFFTQMCQNVTTAANISCGDASTGPKTPFGITEHWKQIAIFILAVGMILQGVAKSPRQPFIITYLDDNLPKTKTSIYLGVIVGMSFFGPALAFGLGAVFSSMYITLEETSMTPRDPRFLGAWWLGFVIFGAAGIVVGLPLIFFPKHMRKRVELKVVKQKKKSDVSGIKRVWLDLKGLLKATMHLAFNPVYVCLTLAGSVDLMAGSGMMSFFTKYLETQFTITPSQSSLTLGVMNVLIACIGTSLGGCLTSRLKLSPIACLKFIIGCKILVTGLFALGFAVGCKQPVIHMGHATTSTGSQVSSQCTQYCNCDDTDFFPVCGDDGRNYFSPCHAGCLSMNDVAFTNCSCMASNQTQGTARGGLCISECTNLYPYLVLISIGGFITMVTLMPSFIVSIRCVKEEDKPFAVGFSAFAGTLIGWFPGPVIFGSLVDSTCIIWRTTCGTVGACSLYDIELFRLRIHALMMGLRIIALIFLIMALMFALCSKQPVFQPHIDEVSIAVTANGHKNGSGGKKGEAGSNTNANSDNKETYI